jgi:hypothetical protein
MTESVLVSVMIFVGRPRIDIAKDLPFVPFSTSDMVHVTHIVAVRRLLEMTTTTLPLLAQQTLIILLRLTLLVLLLVTSHALTPTAPLHEVILHRRVIPPLQLILAEKMALLMMHQRPNDQTSMTAGVLRGVSIPLPMGQLQLYGLSGSNVGAVEDPLRGEFNFLSLILLGRCI